MSQVKISGNASGTGVFTVASPNSNNTQTLTLPDATATLVGDTATQTLTNKTLTTPTISGNANMTGGTKYQVGGVTTNALAWVNFNGTGTVAIRSAYNVSSITDNGTGDYTLNFTTALSDANYACVTGSSNNTGIFGTMSGINFNTAPTTTACRIYTTNDGGGANDPIYVTVAIFGN